MIAVDWANLDVAGAFVLGAILATIATLSIMRLAVKLLAEIQRDSTKR